MDSDRLLLFLVVGGVAYWYWQHQQGGDVKNEDDKVEQHFTTGNNGSCNCKNFCAKNWHGQLPKQWRGAKCAWGITTKSKKRFGCNKVPNTLPFWKKGDKVKCMCTRNDSTPWVPKGKRCQK